jgi:hypothetical protein
VYFPHLKAVVNEFDHYKATNPGSTITFQQVGLSADQVDGLPPPHEGFVSLSSLAYLFGFGFASEAYRLLWVVKMRKSIVVYLA